MDEFIMDVEIDLPKQVNFNWKKILLSVLPVALVAGLLVARIGTKGGRAEEDFVSAATAFTKWDQIVQQDPSELSNLERLATKHPELRAHYDAPIAQSLLAAKVPLEAAPYIERTLKRTNQPYYRDYAMTSLTIGEEKYEEALNEALALKEKMSQEKEDSPLLAFNLLRIATLFGELKDQMGELQAWKELKSFGGWNEQGKKTDVIGRDGFKQLLSHFSVQETTLLDYIKSREEELSP